MQDQHRGRRFGAAVRQADQPGDQGLFDGAAALELDGLFLFRPASTAVAAAITQDGGSPRQVDINRVVAKQADDGAVGVQDPAVPPQHQHRLGMASRIVS